MKSKVLIAAVAALLGLGLSAIAPAGASASSVGSNMWVGNIALGHNITGVSGSWTIPTTPTEPGALVYTWFGIGGFNSPGMLQEGVGSWCPINYADVATTTCTPRVFPWYFAE
jgi:hypothetical protein